MDLSSKFFSDVYKILGSTDADSINTTENYLGVEQDLTDAPSNYLGPLQIGK